MKKTMFLVLFAALSAPAAFAQFTYGVKGGLNLSTVTNLKNDVTGETASMKPSIYVGTFGEYQFCTFFGVASEIVYSRQGAAASWTEVGTNTVDVKAKYRFNYLNIPMLAKFYVLDGFSVDLGPQFGFLLNAKYHEKAGSTKTNAKITGAKGFELAVGMGLTYDLGPVFVQGRYNLGLTDVAKHNDSGKKLRNNTLQFGVGCRF